MAEPYETTVGELNGGGGYWIRGGEWDGWAIYSLVDLADDKVKVGITCEGMTHTMVWAGTRRITVEDDPFMGLS